MEEIFTTEAEDILANEDAMDTASSETMAPDASVSSDDLQVEIKIDDAFMITDDYVLTVGTEDAVLMVEPLETEEAPTRLDNILTLGMVALLALTVIVAVIRKAVRNRRPAPVVVEEISAAPTAEAPGSAGKLKLYDTDPKTAALLMAIVADKLQKPLNELRFISIKEVE